MRAYEPIVQPVPFCKETIDYINQLRVDRLMAKARYFYNEWEQSDKDYADYECIDDRIRAEKSKRIAEAYKDRANKIKEGM